LDFTPIADAFMNGLAGGLTMGGLVLQPQAPGPADRSIVIRSQVVRADPGSRLLRYIFTWFAGAAVFEVEGQFGSPVAQLGSFHFKATRRAGLGGGDSLKLLIAGAKQAGQNSATQILTVLASI
jgi:hypothetical protein